MAWAGPILDQQFNSSASATTFLFSPSSTIAVGTLIVLVLSRNTTNAFASVADNSVQAGAANTYTQAGTKTGTASRGEVYYCVATRSILPANTITATLTGTATRRSGKMLTFTGQAAASPLDASVTAGAGSPGTNLVIGPTPTLAVTGELALGCSFWQGGPVASGVANVTAGYTLSTASTGSGGTASRVEANVAYKTTAGTAAESNNQTFTSATVNNVLGILVTFKPAAGTVFAQSVSGAMSFAGSSPRPKAALATRRSGALSFTGTRTSSPTARLVQSTFAPAGSVVANQSLLRTLAALILPSGALNRTDNHTLTGAFTPAGALPSKIHAVAKTLTGALSFAGAVTHLPGKLLAAALTPAGSLVGNQAIGRTLAAAALAPVGTLKRATSRTLAAAASFSGLVAATSRGALAASFTPHGATTHGVQQRTLFAVFQPTAPPLVRDATRLLLAALQASAVIHSTYIPTPPPTQPASAGGGGDWVTFRDPFAAWPHVGRRRK